MKRTVRPIQYQISRSILVTSTIVLLLTGLAYHTFEFLTFRENTVEKITILGEVIANNSTAAIAFDSQEEANDILEALRAEKHIAAAILYDVNGNLFAQYPKDIDNRTYPAKLEIKGYYFANSFLHVFQPVIMGSRRVGTLYLRYGLKEFNKQFLLFGFTTLTVFGLSLLLAYFLSSKLRKRISRPIISLTNVARNISINKDYSVRAIKESDNEIGILTDAFNLMLTQIEQQNLIIQESEKNFRTLADNIQSLCWMADADGWIYWYNSRWYKYTNTTIREMEGWGWQAVQDPEMLPLVMKNWKDSISNGKPFNMVFPLRGGDGKYRPFLTQVMPVRDKNGKILKWFGTNTDISELTEVEDALRKSEEFSRTLLDSSPDCVIALDLQGHLLSINPQGKKMLGLNKTTHLNGLHWADFWPNEYREKVIDAIEHAKGNQISHFQGQFQTREGKLSWLDVLIAPVYGSGATVERLVSVSRDITRLKELEQQKDDFLSIASHELKTPVTSLKAYTQFLQDKFEKSKDMQSAAMLKKMDNQLNKLTNLIIDFLDVTRIEQGRLRFRKEHFRFNELIRDIAEDTERISDRHKIIQELSEDHTIYADRERIGQVIANFLHNAIKYSPKADKVVIRTSVNGNNELVFSVQDFGIGLSEENKKKIFERFYRVTGTGLETFPGIGLGLYISAEIIQRHNGKIWVESKKGAGSVFKFSLPFSVESELAAKQVEHE
jgi:PAS domain S-box-containing protein